MVKTEIMATAQTTSGPTVQKTIHQMAYQGDLQQVKVKVLENPK